jgi:serine/threonine protein kinase
VLEAFESGVRMTETQMAYCARETLRALAYIHLNHRIHRDIKVCLLFLRVIVAVVAVVELPPPSQ